MTGKPSTPLRTCSGFAALSSPHRAHTAPRSPAAATGGRATPHHSRGGDAALAPAAPTPPRASHLSMAASGPAQPGLRPSRLRQRRPAARKEKGELPPARPTAGPPRCACAAARACTAFL